MEWGLRGSDVPRRGHRVTDSPKFPPQTPDLGALSALAPELAQTFVSIASDIALVIDAEGVIRNVAVGAANLSSPAIDWIGRPWAETVTGETRRKVEQLLDEVRSTGVTRRREVNHPTPGGDDLPVAYSAIRLGTQGPVLAVGRDLRTVAAIQQRLIDAQQEMERSYWKQRQIEARYRLLFQVATDAVMIVDARTLKVLEANDSAVALFASQGETPVDREAVSGIERGSRPAVNQLLVSARTTGKPGEIRARLAQPHPQTHAVDISATPFRAGDSLLLLVRARMARAHQGVQSSEDRVIDFVDRMPDALVVTDTAGRVLITNPSFVTLCGLTQEPHVLGRTLAELLGDPAGRLAAILALTRRQGIASHERAIIGQATGQRAEIEVSAALLDDSDQESVGLSIRRVKPTVAALPRAAVDMADALHDLVLQIGAAPLPQLLHEVSHMAERHLIEAALARSDGNLALAADMLGMTTEQLAMRVGALGLFGTGPYSSGGTPPTFLN